VDKLPLNQVLCGDNREVMKALPGGSIDLVVTSPPYWGLRDYGEVESIWGGELECEHEFLMEEIPQRGNRDIGFNERWGNSPGQKKQEKKNLIESKRGFCANCGAWRGQLGLEPHPQMFVDHLVEVSREIRRVIKPRGSYWLNLGDTYYGSHAGKIPQTKNPNVKIPEPPSSSTKGNWLQPKQLLGIPWRVATALQEDGWILRNCVIWYKPNHMPESVKDRLTKSYEFVFFFVKQRKYYFNLDRIRVPHAPSGIDRAKYSLSDWKGSSGNSSWVQTKDNPQRKILELNPLGKNPGDVLTKHEIATGRIGNFSYDDPLHNKAYNPKGKNPGDYWEIPTYPFPGAHFAVFPPALIEPIIKAGCPKNGVVLDPFAGSGTALRVARKLGRRFIGIEINPEYAAMCERRVRADKYQAPPDGVPTLTELLDRE